MIWYPNKTQWLVIWAMAGLWTLFTFSLNDSEAVVFAFLTMIPGSQIARRRPRCPSEFVPVWRAPSFCSA